MLFSNAKKSLIMLKKCTYNSQYIAHYAQVELTIILTKTNMRYEETQLHHHRVQPFQFYMCSDSKLRVLPTLVGSGKGTTSFGTGPTSC